MDKLFFIILFLFNMSYSMKDSFDPIDSLEIRLIYSNNKVIVKGKTIINGFNVYVENNEKMDSVFIKSKSNAIFILSGQNDQKKNFVVVCFYKGGIGKVQQPSYLKIFENNGIVLDTIPFNVNEKKIDISQVTINEWEIFFSKGKVNKKSNKNGVYFTEQVIFQINQKYNAFINGFGLGGKTNMYFESIILFNRKTDQEQRKINKPVRLMESYLGEIKINPI